MSAGHRAYEWLCDWVAENENRFYHHEYVPGNDIYGMIENDIAYINPKVFRDSLLNAGFNSSATLSYLRSNKLIVTSKSDEYTKAKRIGSTSKRYIWLKLVSEYDECDEEYL